MSLYGAFDKTKHFSELGDPLSTQGEGYISAATRRQTALRNLTGDSNFTIAQLNVLSNVTPGTAVASKALVLSSTSSLTWAATSALTSAVKLLTYALTLTGVGATVDGALFSATTAVALGDYANALNGKLDFGSAGRVTGLGGVICAELDLGAGCTQGSYACFEAELNMSAAGSLTGTRTSFLSLNVWGNATGVATFDTNGFLFDINGLTANTGKLLREGLSQAVTATARLRCKVGNTVYYIPLCVNEALTS